MRVHALIAIVVFGPDFNCMNKAIFHLLLITMPFGVHDNVSTWKLQKRQLHLEPLVWQNKAE